MEMESAISSELSQCSFDRPKNRTFPYRTELEEGEWDGPFYFIQAADIQMGLIDRLNGVPDDAITWDKEIVLTNKAMDCINKLRPCPKFVAICGDLVDAFPGSERHERQKFDLSNCLKKLREDIPLMFLPGNHDIGNKPTEETIENYKKDFGDDYYSFFFGGVFFIVVNNQLYKDPSKAEKCLAQHEKWLHEQLEVNKTNKYKHCIMFQHIPWFYNSPDEEEDYFNIKPTKRKELLQKFKDAGIRHAFAGHYHINAGGMDGEFEMVVTSAVGLQMGNEKSGMRIVRVFEDNIDHKYYEFDDFPTEISLDQDSKLPR